MRAMRDSSKINNNNGLKLPNLLFKMVPNLIRLDGRFDTISNYFIILISGTRCRSLFSGGFNISAPLGTM